MMGKLEFNLPEENNEFQLAIDAVKYSIVLSEMDQYLRKRLKYEELTDEVQTALQAARDFLWQEINDEGLDI